MVRTAAKHIRRFFASEAGPTAVEYAVMVALIITACVWSIQLMGCRTAMAFQRASDVLGS